MFLRQSWDANHDVIIWDWAYPSAVLIRNWWSFSLNPPRTDRISSCSGATGSSLSSCRCILNQFSQVFVFCKLILLPEKTHANFLHIQWLVGSSSPTIWSKSQGQLTLLRRVLIQPRILCQIGKAHLSWVQASQHMPCICWGQPGLHANISMRKPRLTCLQ